MLSIVDWAICCCASFTLRVSIENLFTRFSAKYHRYCSTCIHLISMKLMTTSAIVMPIKFIIIALFLHNFKFVLYNIKLLDFE